MTGRRRARRAPRHPFWKDERVLRWITTATALRLFIVAVVVALTVLTATIIYFHSNRVQTERDTDRKIRDLACLAVKRVPPGDPTVDDLRRQYRCPAYAKPSSTNPHRAPAPSSTARPTPTPRSSVGVAAGNVAQRVAPAAHAQPSSQARMSGSPPATSSGLTRGRASAPGSLTPPSRPPPPTLPPAAGSGLPSPLPTLPALPCPLAWLPCH